MDAVIKIVQVTLDNWEPNWSTVVRPIMSPMKNDPGCWYVAVSGRGGSGRVALEDRYERVY